MTVLLVLAMFLVFALVDWALSHKEMPATQTVPDTPPIDAADSVYGFHVPEKLRYHPGHGWVMRERKNIVRIGIDDFAARLAGKIESIELPKPGQWLRQGQRSWKLLRNNQTAEMVSPIEGEVLEINPDVVKDPSLLRSDPYGQGWLMTLHVPDEEGTTRNFIPGYLVRGWMESVAEKLYARQPEFAGAVAADPGVPVEDIAEALQEKDWTALTSEFFL
ncbi:MAG: glycine cleavage system protein H [Acidobacteria bacterium]|nr:glycine cleavage system protein H [Acidobacteriota bacterium]